MGYYIDADFTNVPNYGDALAAWTGATPWRNAEEGRRPLGTSAGMRRKKHMFSRKLPDGSVAFTLYRTDVVTYHPDERITIRPSASASTNAFANCLLPPGVNVAFTSLANVLWLSVSGRGGAWYNPTRGFCIGGDHTIIHPCNVNALAYVIDESTPPVPFDRPYIDPVKAHRALKDARYTEFKVWAAAAVALGARGPREHGRWQLSVREQLAALREGGAAWMQLLARNRPTSLATICKELRDAIYREADCIVMEQVPYVETYTQLRNIWNLQRRH